MQETYLYIVTYVLRTHIDISPSRLGHPEKNHVQKWDSASLRMTWPPLGSKHLAVANPTTAAFPAPVAHQRQGVALVGEFHESHAAFAAETSLVGKCGEILREKLKNNSVSFVTYPYYDLYTSYITISTLWPFHSPTPANPPCRIPSRKPPSLIIQRSPCSSKKSFPV